MKKCQGAHEDVVPDARKILVVSFRVTVPDAGELDQLRTQRGVYRRGLYTARNRDNASPERTRSLPASSRESSMEPMDTDDAR